MLALKDLALYAKKYKTNQSVVYREFIQLVFLKEFYSLDWSDKVFFKGGTAIRLLFDGARFSEDLDFTVAIDKEKFDIKINNFWKYLEKTYGWGIKKRKTFIGEKYLLTVSRSEYNYDLFINLDFSFREKVLCPDKSIIKTDYPVVFTSFVHHLSKEEILAEKIRAIMTRKKGRDIYDLWFLLNMGIQFDNKLVLEKFSYYKIVDFDKDKLLDRVIGFSKNQFELDLRPFVSINEREKLAGFFDYILAYIKEFLVKV
jgi:hypothetical protein